MEILNQSGRIQGITAANLTEMIIKGNYPEHATLAQKNEINSLWEQGKVREAQQKLESLLSVCTGSKKDKTLL